jgi:hypothetical protein
VQVFPILGASPVHVSGSVSCVVRQFDRPLPNSLAFHTNFKGDDPLRILDRLSPKSALLAGAVVLTLAVPAVAASGPFAEFNGNWSGSGTIHPESGSPERIRCNGTYSPRGANDLQVKLRCASDSYKFDLIGELTASSTNQISGQWNENSRGIGGTVSGTANGNRMLMHTETAGFSADLTMIMQGKRQAVSISSHGGGEIVKASITMTRH